MPYDFSKGERGRFYRRDARLNLPVYLDEDVRRLVEDLATRSHREVSTVVNDLLKSDMRLADTVK